MFSFFGIVVLSRSAKLHNNFVGNILNRDCQSIRHEAEKRQEKTTYPLELLEGQADAVLHPNLVADTAFLAQDRDSLHLDAVLHDTRVVAGYRSRGTLDASPCTNAAVPANDGVQHAGVMLDLGVFQDDRLLDASTGTDDGARSNRNIGPELRGGVNTRAGVDVNRRNDVG